MRASSINDGSVEEQYGHCASRLPSCMPARDMEENWMAFFRGIKCYELNLRGREEISSLSIHKQMTNLRASALWSVHLNIKAS